MRTNILEPGREGQNGLRVYRITADAIVGCGKVYRQGQTVTETELAGYGEHFANLGAVEVLFPAETGRRVMF